jgi:hypothetical protein
MSKKRYINTVFWNDEYIFDLDPIEKLIFIYLITNPATNIIGAYQIPIKRISIDTGIEKDMCQKIINRFQSDEKLLYNDGWIALKNFAKHQNYKSPFIQTSMENEYNILPLFIKEWLKDGMQTVLNKHISISKSRGKSKGKNGKRILPKDYQDIINYAKEKNMILDTKFFYDYFTESNWIDSNGKSVQNFKLKMQTWNKNEIEKQSKDNKPPRREREIVRNDE